MEWNHPSGYVPKYYIMDPKTDDLLMDGTKLEVGMIVLIGEDRLRAHLSLDNPSAISDELVSTARKYNRWIRIDELKNRGETVHILGTHRDGTKSQISVSIFYPWYVQKSSMPKSDD